MTEDRDFHEHGYDAAGLTLLARARAMCGLGAGPVEALSPEIEAEACKAFRRLAEFLEALAATRKPKGEAA